MRFKNHNDTILAFNPTIFMITTVLNAINSTPYDSLQRLLENQQQELKNQSLCGTPPSSWLDKKRAQWRNTLERFWGGFEKIKSTAWELYELKLNAQAVFTTTMIILIAFFAPSLLSALLSKVSWYIPFLIVSFLFGSAWGMYETLFAYTYVKTKKKLELAWGDTVVFENKDGGRITKKLLEKSQYTALVRAFAHKYPQLPVSQQLVATLDTIKPYHAHQISNVMKNDFSVDAWSVIEVGATVTVEAPATENRTALAAGNTNKIFKI